jgi:heavy metal-(Cd/Co/Hg/Pb/Zn)-translocating P-type ATPase
VRLADRYATWFLPATLLVAAVAWLLSGDPVRAVAVLVVATPCPLLLATPIAIVSGMSRAARRGVVVRGGGALERLGRARTLLLDKTGTLTTGRPAVSEVVTAPGGDRDEVLRLAATVEQLSPHVVAASIVRAATRHGLALPVPTGVVEQPGAAVSGVVDGRTVEVGRLTGDVPDWAGAAVRRVELDGTAVAWVSVDRRVVGMILLDDPVRPDAARTVRRLREAGLRRLVMVTGDRARVAARIARLVGIEEVVADCSPADKVAHARRESAAALTVMVGDGVNDAPALAAADVGVAMGGRGATAAAEVADAVMTVDRLDRLADTVSIAGRSRRIATQSAVVGMGLSLLAMLVAAAGYLPPALGALLQEGIDVLVIANALRALGGGLGTRRLAPETSAMLRRFAAEHEELWQVLIELRDSADLVAREPGSGGARDALARVHRRLVEEILPHEYDEEHRLYPALARPLGSGEATATMSRMHGEIERLVERIGIHLRQAPGPRLPAAQIPDLLATLYGLDVILRLHFIQEEEQFFSLVSEAGPPVRAAAPPAPAT